MPILSLSGMDNLVRLVRDSQLADLTDNVSVHGFKSAGTRFLQCIMMHTF